MTKAYQKAIMTRSKLKTVYLKNRNTTTWNNFKHQRNFCTNLLRNTKSDKFRNLNVKDLNQTFWKKMKTFFSGKGLASSNILLKEKDNLITDNQKLENCIQCLFY